jgi:hypothetical protein
MIIFINGSINSGKTTVGKLLADHLSNTALLEFDDIRNMFHWMPLDEAIPLTIDLGLNLVRDFVNHNMSVIVPYPLSLRTHDLILERLKDLDQEIYFFTLSPTQDEALKNRGTRELTDWENERIIYHYNTGINNPSFGTIIDNTNQTPEETVKEILEKLPV